jgi:uncharacterized protein YndB with AHSA1/START domain
MTPRAEIVDTGSRWARAARIQVDVPAQAVFDVLADPAQHAAFDGSGTVQGLVSGPERLALGSRFGMSMRIKVPYRVDNTVVEFEEGRLIAWSHINRHRWRYELEPVGEGATLVTETFDGRTARFPPALLLINAVANNQVAVAKTLVRLKAYVEHGNPEQGDRA